MGSYRTHAVVENAGTWCFIVTPLKQIVRRWYAQTTINDSHQSKFYDEYHRLLLQAVHDCRKREIELNSTSRGV